MKIKLFTATVICLLGVTSRAQLVVDNTITLDEAIAILLGPNVQFSNPTFSGLDDQFGSFNSANANVGLTSGIILATGAIENAIGPNISGSSSMGDGNFGASDPDLDELDGLTHNDAAILEFDFVATGSSVSFEYVFASEEYPEYTGAGACGDVSDVFGFFLSGPGINGTFSNNGVNIALIPNTTQFVSIHNLNAGCDGLAEPGDTDCNYCQYYVFNGTGGDAPYNGSGMYVQYDGLTTVLTAFYEGLECGETYHIKLALADVSDSAWDSGVFLKEGSFSVTGSFIEATVNQPSPDLGDEILLEGCINGTITIHPPACAADELEVQLVTSGIAINGLDYDPIPSSVTIQGEDVNIPLNVIFDNLVEGTEEFIISMIYTNQDGELDTATASLNILDYITPTVVIPDVFICDQSAGAFPQISGGFGPYSYDWSNGATTPTVIFNDGDAGDYILNVTDYCGTAFDSTFSVIEPTPFVVDPFVDICFSLTSNTIASGGAAPYIIVLPEDSLELVGDYQLKGLVNGVYPLIIQDQCGSSGASLVTVQVCETKIPNVFTPNGDGFNDTFHIFGLEGFPNSTVMVFDRWGNKVLEDTDYRNNWSGDDLSDGVYYYIVKRSDGKTYEGRLQKMDSK